MANLATTKMSSKGQIVIPEDIRKHLIAQVPWDIEIQDGMPEDCTIYQRHFIILFLQSFQEVVRCRTFC